MSEVKNPSILEKLCGLRVGVILSCIEVVVVRAMAINRPAIVTVRAVNLRGRDMVMT